MNDRDYQRINYSYGIVAYSFDENNEIRFLLSQKRDTYEYVEFIRGVWNKESSVPYLFSKMSVEERKRIIDYTFEELWNDLWIKDDISFIEFNYDKSKKQYSRIKNKILYYLNETNTKILEPQWEFPKGKKKHSEDKLVAAKREFEEETCLYPSKLNVLSDKTYQEIYEGTNGKKYSTIYFVAKYPDIEYPKYIDTSKNIRKQTVSDESINVGWFSYEEACEKFVSFNYRKQILIQVYEKIKNDIM